ncbi:MAG: hypothetical protein J6L92_04340, partial [Clostridia bacterium]|nr:hypothetical protein [Clostridia bacterium]
PDVSTLLALSNFFDVTLDELFDRTSNDKEKDMEKYYALDNEYSNQGDIIALISLWREATQKYPGDFDCWIKLAYSLEATVYSGGENEEIERNAKESLSICERILRDCTQSDTRNSAIQILVHLYSQDDLSIADEDAAVKYAMMAGSLFACREALLEHAYFTEESKDKKKAIKHLNMLNYMDLLTMNLYYGKYESEEEKINACNAALTLWNTLIYDGNYQFFHCRIQKIYLSLAMSYAKLKKSRETIEAIKKALHHANCYDNLPKREVHYTSTFVNAATSDASISTKNYTFTNAEDVIRISKLKIFDFVRTDLDLGDM